MPSLIKEALNENLNTPKALQIIDEAFARTESSDPRKVHQPSLVSLLETVDDLLGLQLQASTPDIDDDSKQIILERQRARETKNWAKSDEIRSKLEQLGIGVRDTPDGAVWTYY